MSENAPPLTPLQEKLRINAMMRMETAKNAMLAPVFAALESRGAYFTYEANPALIRHFWDSMMPLHPRAFKMAPRHDYRKTDSLDREIVQTTLETMIRDHALEGPVHIHFPRQIYGQPRTSDPMSDWFGFITCDLGHAVSLTVDICEARFEIIELDGLVIAGVDRSWAIWVDGQAIELNALR